MPVTKNVNWQTASRIAWNTEITQESNEKSFFPGNERIQMGCLQRIADASEAMAKNHNELLRDLNWARESRDSYKNQCNNYFNSTRTLRGVITKKNKLIEQLKADLMVATGNK